MACAFRWCVLLTGDSVPACVTCTRSVAQVAADPTSDAVCREAAARGPEGVPPTRDRRHRGGFRRGLARG